jgi:hypothetical protein
VERPREHAAVVWLDDPDNQNALSGALTLQLERALGAALGDPTLRSVVLTGVVAALPWPRSAPPAMIAAVRGTRGIPFGPAARAVGSLIRDPVAGCRYSLVVNQAQDTRIEQGRIESGPATLAAVLVIATEAPTAGLVLRDLQVEARGATGIGGYFDAPVSSAILYDSVCFAGFPRPIVDGTGGRVLRAQDPAGSACRP